MPKHTPSSGSGSRDQSGDPNRSHQPGVVEVFTDTNTGDVTHVVANLDVLETTRLILQDENVPGGIGYVEPQASSSDIAECIQQLTRRLVAEADRTDEAGANSRQMWESVLL